MTDNEIIKSLECHNVAGHDCENCPANSLNSWWCFDHVISEALKIIKRQSEFVLMIESIVKEMTEEQE